MIELHERAKQNCKQSRTFDVLKINETAKKSKSHQP
jgi:hypothetical protein